MLTIPRDTYAGSAHSLARARTRAPWARTARLLLAVAMVACVLLGGVATAAAQDAEVEAFESVYVGLYDLGPGEIPTLVITGVAPEDIEPPTRAALPVPSEASLSWAGEILGGDPANDPTMDVELEEADGYDLIRFELTRSRVAQLELTVPEAMVERSGEEVAIDLSWTSAGALESAVLAVSSSLDMHLVEADPEPETVVMPDSVLYSVETTPVASGETLGLSGRIVAGPDPALAEAAEEGAATGTTPSAEPEGGTAEGDTPDGGTAEEETLDDGTAEDGATDGAVADEAPTDEDAGTGDGGLSTGLVVAVLAGAALVAGFFLVREFRRGGAVSVDGADAYEDAGTDDGD